VPETKRATEIGNRKAGGGKASNIRGTAEKKLLLSPPCHETGKRGEGESQLARQCIWGNRIRSTRAKKEVPIPPLERMKRTLAKPDREYEARRGGILKRPRGGRATQPTESATTM